MMYELTIFKNQFDNKTHRTQEFQTWEKFVKLLRKLSNQEGQKGGRNSSPLITPARYLPKTTRSNRNVDYWGSWCCLDVDDFGSTTELMPSIRKFCGQYTYVMYSTASSTPLQPKFRLVFPLTRRLERNEIPHFWYAFNQHMGEIGDKQTKDLSRMYYVPAQYPDAFNFFTENEGQDVDPDEIMSLYEYKQETGNSFLDRLPPELQNAVIEHRKNQVGGSTAEWTSYRDCPFFPRGLAAEYQSLTGTGWYSKMYQIMVAIAGRAIERNYPITAKQIAELIREFDNDTGRWYENRPLEVEADRALEYIYRNQ